MSALSKRNPKAKKTRDIHEVESSLLDLEGILMALVLIRDDHFNVPGPEHHALSVLIKKAVDTTEELRNKLWPPEATQ